MVFCYKVITDTPRRGLSPRKSPELLSKIRSIFTELNSVSQLINTLDYEPYSDVFDSIPEREWRLLAALARKREENDEREKLAEQFRKMWQKEKEEREMVEAESHDEYKRYIKNKREQERSWLEYKRLQRDLEQQTKAGQLLDCIKYKERRSADLLAWKDDRKTTELIDKALEDEARAQLAAERRMRLGEADQWRRRMELYDTQQRADDARKRKNAMLKTISRNSRVAITNALSSWESSIHRGEVLAMEAARREMHLANVALNDIRSARIKKARDSRLIRARRMAAITAQLREVVRSGRS
ncbi:hypothetical protein K1T71_011462 [Dendrolimus kikuchii]|uniref:Uncharacterized protein n=1 Tax=Dendrolimus kikuchii TaxID=765133 RepID=A0ACC1CP94_9NEOP|nr:hypothetical protein K1T71_011462 [Dendrolimus kikuchii]